MDILKKIFPHAFTVKDVTSLIIKIVIYVLIGGIGGAIIGLLGSIPVVCWFTNIFGTIIGLYALGGVILSILVFLKIVK